MKLLDSLFDFFIWWTWDCWVYILIDEKRLFM
jgi:hypothetical protein